MRGVAGYVHSHRSEMYLASGTNLSRSEHHTSSSCFLSPYGRSRQRGTCTREARCRRARENVYHDCGRAIGTGATLCRSGFLTGTRPAISLEAAALFFLFFCKSWGCSLSPPSVFRDSVPRVQVLLAY